MEVVSGAELADSILRVTALVSVSEEPWHSIERPDQCLAQNTAKRPDIVGLYNPNPNPNPRTKHVTYQILARSPGFSFHV